MAMLRRHRWLILLALLAAATVGLALSLGRTLEREAAPECETITMVLPTYGFVPDDMGEVLERMNERSEALCGVRIEPLFVSADDLELNAAVRLQGGEEIDLMPCMEGSLLARYIDAGEIAPLDELLDAYGRDIRASCPERQWEALGRDGTIYAVAPNLRSMSTEGLVIRRDVLDAAGISPEELTAGWNPRAPHSVAEVDALLTPLFEAIRSSDAQLSDGAAVSGMKLAASTNGLGGVFSQCRLIYSEGFGNSFGCAMDGSGRLVNLYATDEYRDMLRLVRAWQQAGYIYAMNAQLGENPTIVYEGGKVFGFLSDTSPGMEASYSTQSGHETVCIPLVAQPITSEMIQVGNWVIPAASQRKEAAMKLLNLMFSDSEYVSLYVNGIEGVHYARRPDGSLEILSDGYTQHLTWIFGGAGGEGATEPQEDAVYSDYYGFTYDGSRCAAQIEAMNATLEAALPDLLLGRAPDVDAALDALNRTLEAHGLNDVLRDKQEQLTAWLEGRA